MDTNDTKQILMTLNRHYIDTNDTNITLKLHLTNIKQYFNTIKNSSTSLNHIQNYKTVHWKDIKDTKIK